MLQLVDAWTMTTWNGDRWNMVSNGIGNYQNQNWVLMLDGIKMELMKLDAPNINTIGISVYDIERIEIINVAGNYLGEFNDNGIIHIVTKKNKAGFTYRAIASNGNESGDPHLNAINNLNLNIHEYGTNFSQFLGFNKKKWNIQLSQNTNNYFYRDTSLFVYPLVSSYNSKPEMYNIMFSGRLLATYTSTRSTHQFSINASQADDAIMPSGIFNPITGKYNYYTAGYMLRYAIRNGVLQYRGGFTNRSFNGDLHQIITHQQLYHSHNINYTTHSTLKTGKVIKQFGVDFISSATSVERIDNNKIVDYLIRPYFSYTFPLSKKSTIFTDVGFATNFNNLLPKLSFGYYKQPSIITNWSIVASFSKRNQFENNTHLYLLSIKDTNGLNISNNSSSLATVDYFFNLNVSKYFKLSFNSGLKYLNNELNFKPTETMQITPPFLYNTNLSYTIQTCWINRVNLHYDMQRNTKVDINYLRNGLLFDKSDLYHAVPKHKITATITQTLPSRFYVWARYYYQSPTQFINPYILIQNNYFGAMDAYIKLNSLYTFDVGVTKKLMKEYLITNLTVRNIFNTYERYQANGAGFNLRLFLSVRINI